MAEPHYYVQAKQARYRQTEDYKAYQADYREAARKNPAIKAAQQQYGKDYRAANREKLREYSRKYKKKAYVNAANAEAYADYKAYQREYHKRNREKLNSQKRAYYRKNKVRINAKIREQRKLVKKWAKDTERIA